MKPHERAYPHIQIQPKPRRWSWWRRPKPELRHRLLALHIAQASTKSALR